MSQQYGQKAPDQRTAMSASRKAADGGARKKVAAIMAGRMKGKSSKRGATPPRPRS